MKGENTRNTFSQDKNHNFDADAEFHIALGWLAAMSVSIASAALAFVT